MTAMDVDLTSLHKILKDQTRRKIILHLNKRGKLTYMELMNLLEITNTGKFNYHLKALDNLIEKTEDGKYCLTETGQLASQLLHKFPEKTIETKRLGAGDALLIGIFGFLLQFVFPVLYIGIGILVLSYSLAFVYELVIPGAVMWWLTVRRTKSHDFYDLLKPPIIPLALLVGLLVLLLVVNAPSLSSSWFIFAGLGFASFIGVIIAESGHRLRKLIQ